MSRKIKVNMTGVESYTRCPEGEHLAKLKKIEEGTVQGSGDDCLKAQFEVIKGDSKGCLVFETFSLTEKALWKLKSFLEAAGTKADGKMVLDLDKLEGKTCIIDVIHDEYNGVKRAKIASYMKPSEVEDDDDEDVDDIDEDEEEETPKKSSKKSTKAQPAKKSKKTDEDEDEDEDDEDDDDEDEEPVKKSSKKSSKKEEKSTKSSKKTKKEEDDWEDDEDDD
jgi:hypothetical protein